MSRKPKSLKESASEDNTSFVDILNARRANLYLTLTGKDGIPDEQLPPGSPISPKEVIPTSPQIVSDSTENTGLSTSPLTPSAPVTPAKPISATSSFDLTPQVLEIIKDRTAQQTRAEEAEARKHLQDQLDKAVQALDDAREESVKKDAEYKASLVKTQQDSQAIMNLLISGSDIVGTAVAESSQFAVKDSYRVPYVHGSGGRFSDAYREMDAILRDSSRSPSYLGYNPATGQQVEKRDTSALDKFVVENRKEAKDGLERALKQQFGLLTGSTSVRMGKDAPTTQGTVAPLYNEMLSSFLRTTHSVKCVFWPFAESVIQVERNAGDTINIARFLYGDVGTATSDWELGPTSLITSARQPMQASSVALLLKEYGMGASEKIRPISIPEFIQATSIDSLLSALQINLRANYEMFEDISIRREYQKTTRVVYNNNSSVDTVVGNLNTASNGTLTLGFLSELRAYLSGLQIPTFPDGSYAIIVNSKALAQLVRDIGQSNQFISRQSIEEVTNLVKEINRFPDLRINGYQFNACGFMIIESNAISGGPAPSEGVQTVTTGAGAKIARSSYAFGRGCVAKGIASPFSIRQECPPGQFHRFTDYTWTEISGVAALDVDPASNPATSASQQLRVVEVRTLDTEI